MSDSNPHPDAGKPAGKPRPDFPLNIHKGTGYWCKKINGRVFYFGRVADDPMGIAAEELYLEEKDDLEAGREPREKAADALRVGQLCDTFLEAKKADRDSGELNQRTYWGYNATCENIKKAFGKNRAVSDLVPNDFRKLRAALAKTRHLVALGNEIIRVRTVFKFAADEGLIPSLVRFGQAFSKPDADNVTKERNAHRMEHGARMFEAAEIRQILAACGQPLKAMVLLGANCAFGQSDCSSLPLKAVNLETGWIDFPRPKTGVSRRIPLWPETVAAIREWLPMRPKAKDPADAKLLFLTCRGARWVKLSPGGKLKKDGKRTQPGAPNDAIGQEFAKVLAKLNLTRSRRSFYGLRHGFETIGGETADQNAVDVIMGHKIKGMAENYVERIGDDRRRRVVDHVHDWLFGDTPSDDDGAETEAQAIPITSARPEATEGKATGPALRLYVG